jgi:hypothetical protein
MNKIYIDIKKQRKYREKHSMIVINRINIYLENEL